MIIVQVFDRVAYDVSVRERISVALEVNHEQVRDVRIGPLSENGIRIGSDAYSDLLHPAIIVVTGNVVDADPAQVMGRSLFECQERALRGRRGP